VDSGAKIFSSPVDEVAGSATAVAMERNKNAHRALSVVEFFLSRISVARVTAAFRFLTSYTLDTTLANSQSLSRATLTRVRARKWLK